MDEMDDADVNRGIEGGMNPDSGIDYNELSKLIDMVNQGEASSEEVNPRMSKNDLRESMLGSKPKEIIKTIKVKDLRNE